MSHTEHKAHGDNLREKDIYKDKHEVSNEDDIPLGKKLMLGMGQTGAMVCADGHIARHHMRVSIVVICPSLNTTVGCSQSYLLL